MTTKKINTLFGIEIALITKIISKENNKENTQYLVNIIKKHKPTVNELIEYCAELTVTKLELSHEYYNYKDAVNKVVGDMVSELQEKNSNDTIIMLSKIIPLISETLKTKFQRERAKDGGNSANERTNYLKSYAIELAKNGTYKNKTEAAEAISIKVLEKQKELCNQPDSKGRRLKENHLEERIRRYWLKDIKFSK